MKKVLFWVVILVVFGGCSFKTEPNLWQYKSALAFESYKNDFLRGEDALAKSEYERALDLAKSSDDLRQLGAIYLGKCALDLAVGIKNECKEYAQIDELIGCKKLHNYFLFLRNDTKTLQPTYLPSRYDRFAKALVQGDYEAAKRAQIDIEDPASAMIALELLRTHASKRNIEVTLKKVSFYGYKKGVVHLLEKLKNKTNDIKEKKRLEKKITILTKE